MAKLEIEHRKLLAEEGITKTDLPKEIQAKITDFNELVEEYVANPDEDTKAEIIDYDVEICDEIQDWFDNLTEEEKEKYMSEEEAEEEEEEAPVATKKKTATPTAQTPPPAPVETAPPAPVAEVVATPPPAPAPVEDTLEDKVRKRISANVISAKDLEAILGQEPEQPIQVIGSLKLKKQYLKASYEVA